MASLRKKEKILKNILLILSLCLLCISGCFTSDDVAVRRAKKAQNNKGDIVIGAVADWDNITGRKDLRWDGIELAVKEINKKGGILGRKVRIIKKDDDATFTKAMSIAEELSDNIDVCAVIGHEYSFISIPASVIYQFGGLLMISPASSSPRLTERNFNFVFMVVQNDNEVGKQLAEYAHSVGYRRIMIYHIRDTYGMSIARAFEKRAGELGLEILDLLSYDSVTKDRVFYSDFLHWKNNYNDFDAVFLAARDPENGAKIITQARKAKINAQFIGTDSLDSDSFISYGGEAVQNTVVPSAFYPLRETPEVKKFVELFKKEYNRMPDTSAALYYDTAIVLFYAISQAGTTVPEKIVDALHNIKNFEGVTGKITFTEDGDVADKKSFLKIVKDNKFIYLDE